MLGIHDPEFFGCGLQQYATTTITKENAGSTVGIVDHREAGLLDGGGDDLREGALEPGKRARSHELLSVVGQLTNLMIMGNVEKSRQSLGTDDVLVKPALGKELTSADFAKSARGVEIGYTSTMAMGDSLNAAAAACGPEVEPPMVVDSAPAATSRTTVS